MELHLAALGKFRGSRIGEASETGLMLCENCVKGRLEILISKSVSDGGWAF
jgi:hypothetical protein